MVSFGQLERLIRAGEFDQVATALLSVDEPARRALAAPVKGIELHWVEEAGTPWKQRIAWRAARQAALRIAGAGCLPRAADIVSFLRSGRFDAAPSPAALDALVRVLRAPGRPSVAAIAQALADKLRTPQADLQWGMISRLLAEAELSPPGTEAVVRGWMGQVGAERYRKDLAGLLRADPHTTEMLPHIFGIARLGQEMDEEWTKALARLAADGVIDRQSLLDGCVQRLVAGDRPGAIRRVVVLHRLLDPTAEEFAARRAECLAMLAGPESTVADLALQGLRRADDAGLVEIDTVAEAAFTVLLRKEKKLVRAQLDWLGAALARKADPLLFEALLTGLGNPAVDLAEQVLRAAATHLPVFGAAGRESLAAAVAVFQGDLRRQAEELLGAGGPADPAPVALPPVAAAAPVPPPIRSVPELAAEVRHLLREVAPDPVRVELVLDALVRFTVSDRPTLAGALAPLVPNSGSPLLNLLRAVVTGQWFTWSPSREMKRAPAPMWMLFERLIELTRQVCAGSPPPALLATPATVDGHVDPARVVRLLGEGWEPGAWDLSQALLRLPREIGPEVRAAADRLTSDAGRALAGFLAGGGLPDPQVVTVAVGTLSCPHIDGHYCECSRRPARRTVAFPPIEHTLTVPAGLLGQPRKEAAARAYTYNGGYSLDPWPLVFPSHRELAAAHVQPRIIESAESRGAFGHVGILPALAACDGPFGPAMALCLAYGLTAARPESRVSAVDAFLDLAARGVLDGTLVGRELAALHRAELIVLKRVADGLAEAARAGAAPGAWAALRELVPAVLAADTPGAGAPDLLLTAESVAAAVHAGGEIPEVTAVAARGGRTRLVTEATRLARTLASAPKTVVPEI